MSRLWSAALCSSRRLVSARSVRTGVIGILAVALLIAASPVGASVMRQLSLGSASPATGHAEVIAHGVSAMPAAQLAWRVVQDTAEAADDAEYQERALGFALADGDGVVISDATYGTQTRLAPGEAGFVAEGAFQHRASTGKQANSYYRIALVPGEQAADAGGDALVFGGDGFAGPSDGAGHDLDLVRDVLQDDEATEIADSGYPVLVFATAGAIEVTADNGEPVQLNAGEAGQFSGNLTIQAVGGDEATFVAGIIGPAVPAAPPPPRTTGTITVTTAFCPAEMTAETFDPEQCQAGPVEGDLNLILANDSQLKAVDDDAAKGNYAWAGLAFGSYGLAKPDQQEGFATHVLLDPEGNQLDPAKLAVSQQAPDLAATLYFLAVPAETGSVSLATYLCPEGMTPETIAGDFCDLADGGFDWVFGNEDGSIQFGIADAEGDGQPYYTWGDLPYGDYFISPMQIPDGYEVYVLPGAEDRPQGVKMVTVSAEQPDLQLSAYYFVSSEEPTGNGSLTATFSVCPEGALPSNYDPNTCELIDDGFDVTIINYDDGSERTLADADGSGGTYTWSDLPLGQYSILPEVPEGYDLYDVAGADGGGVASAHFVILAEDNPDRGVDVYFFLPSGNVGTVAVAGYACPEADSDDQTCIDSGLAGLNSVELYDADGNLVPSNGHGAVFGWGEAEGLPNGTYTIVLTGIEDGYVVDRVVGAADDGDGDQTTWLIEVTDDNPNPQANVFLVPEA